MPDTDHKTKFDCPDSLWKTTATALDPIGCLQAKLNTDLLIIGAGYTGLSTALHAIDGDLINSATINDIVIIDQAQPGWGCSGRNGGQIIPHWKSALNQLRDQYLEQSFDSFIKMQDESARLVFDLIDKFNIDCDPIQTGNIISSRGKNGCRYLKDWVDFWQAYGADVELLDAKATADLIGTDRYDMCLFDHRGGSLQPLSYARGLAKACLQQGIQILANTQALSIAANGKRWLVKTDQGDINCHRLVIATNGYTDKLWPGLAQTIVPVASMITATKPLPDDIASKILIGRQPVAEYAGIPAYYRIDDANRMVFGSRGSLSGGIGKLDTRHLKAKAIQLFASLVFAEWEYDWAGYVAITSPQRPLLTKLGNNAYAGLGYNGRGITTATSMGKQLAYALKGQPTNIPIQNPQLIPCHACYPVGVTLRIVSGHVSDYFTASVK